MTGGAARLTRAGRHALAILALALTVLWSPPTTQAAATEPAGVAVDGLGNVYVADYATDRVLKFAWDGTWLLQWGGRGTGPAQFNGPFGVAPGGDGSVYVVDQLNGRVQRFLADGTFLLAWGVPGATAGRLRTPFGIASAPESAGVYVADFGNDRVQLFTPEGQLIVAWGARGAGPGQFTRPAGVALDRDGVVYVSDHFNDRVQKFSPGGMYLGQIGNPAGALLDLATPIPEAQLRRPEGLAVDRQGNVYVADYGRNRVAKYGPDGQFSGAWGALGAAPGEFSGPKGLAVDADLERVYVADTGNGRIQVFSLDGLFLGMWDLPV